MLSRMTNDPGTEMREFWDERASEDALYFVDNRREYGNVDEEAFWAGGVADLNALLDLVGASLEPTDEVVEIGCGVGRLTRVIASRCVGVTAFDVSGRMVELARERNPSLENVEWVVGDGRTLNPVGDASVDACISHVVFQHIPDPTITLGYVREIGRVLRPGGWSAFQVSNAPAVHVRPLVERAQAAVRAALGRGPKGQADPAWIGSAIELESLRTAAADGGMAIERVYGEGTQHCLVLTRAQG